MRRLGTLAWLGLVGVLATLVLLWAQPAGRDSSMLNRGWNGLSEAADELSAAALVSYADLEGLPPPATLIVMPRLLPEEPAFEVMEALLRSGGTLVVLDDFGFGNDVLSKLGVDVRFGGGTLMDPLHCYRHASMPRVEFVREGSGDETGVMVLNHATWLEVGPRIEVWAKSSYFSYGDVNRNGMRDSSEPVGPLPVAATVARGNGRVVVVADSSLLLNSMVALGDNVEAIGGFVRGDVLVDQVHLPDEEQDRGTGAIEVMRGFVAGGPGTVAILLLLCGFAIGYAWYNRGRQENG